MYAIIGIVLSIAAALFALRQARKSASFYANDVYHMTARSHRNFIVVSLGFAAVFALALRLAQAAAITLLAVYTLLLILYLSSFARGYSGEDE
jgi:FtsH-binding integral membrane protein